MIAVEIRGLSKTYPGALDPALDAIALDIPAGSFFGLLGPNGAGKTTLISVVAGILAADGGEIAVIDGDTRRSPRRARARVGLVPQELAFYPSLTVTENLRFFAGMHGLTGKTMREAVDMAIGVGRLELVRGERGERLSGGLKRRLNLAIGVVHAPALLILDEPTVGVDAQSRLYVQEELKRISARGTTIVYTSHYLEEVAMLCDRIAVVDRGRVVKTGVLADLLREDLVRIKLTRPPSVLFLDALARLPDVSATHVDGASIALVTADPTATLAAALAGARASHCEVVEATLGRRDLESLFFQITGTTLRDAA